MEKTLVKQSDLFLLKSKFFLYRVVVYFTFLLVPILLTKSVNLDISIQVFILTFYMLFMGGQWYLLGKEIDYRLKIFYRANSSMDRILYRLLLGSTIMVLFFNLLYFLPFSSVKYCFWTFFLALGIFYSWPTRGKIIQETLTDQFSEFKFLDGFEKTVIFLTVLMFVFSLPEIPIFQNTDALKLYFDPGEKLHPETWRFLSINYLPFYQYAKTYVLSFSIHFYVFGMGFCLLAFYSLLRYFVSRRLSVLGVFAFISTWSVSKILEHNYLSVYSSSFVVLWVWSLFWSSKSSTYRSGFLVGLIHYYGTCININYAFLLPLHYLISLKFSFKDKTPWFRRQWLKYTALGACLTFISFALHVDFFNILNRVSFNMLLSEIFQFIKIKAFYTLSVFGVFFYLFFQIPSFKKYFKEITLDKKCITELNLCLLAIFLLSFTLEKDLILDFGLLWLLVFFSLLPLEWIFQSISRFRSKRNLIYALYILVCLLDSHFEGRVRIIARTFLSEEVLRYIEKM